MSVAVVIHQPTGTSSMFRHCFTMSISLTLVWSLGCGSGHKDVATAPVKGTVTMDGRPIPSGEIHFELAGHPAKVIEIKGGDYSGEAPIGDNVVSVYVFVEGAASDKYGGERQKQNITSDKFFGPKSALKATVSDGGPNEFPFIVTSAREGGAPVGGGKYGGGSK